MAEPSIQFFASPEAMEQALLVRGANMTVPERLRELRRLNARIFAPLHRALRGRPVEVQLFERLPGETGYAALAGAWSSKPTKWAAPKRGCARAGWKLSWIRSPTRRCTTGLRTTPNGSTAKS